MAETTRIISEYILVDEIVKIINDLLCPIFPTSHTQVGELGHYERCMEYNNYEVLEGTWLGDHPEITKGLMRTIHPQIIDWYIQHGCAHDINKLKWFIQYVPTARMDSILKRLCSAVGVNMNVISCIIPQCSANGLNAVIRMIIKSNMHNKRRIIKIMRARVKFLC